MPAWTDQDNYEETQDGKRLDSLQAARNRKNKCRIENTSERLPRIVPDKRPNDERNAKSCGRPSGRRRNNTHAQIDSESFRTALGRFPEHPEARDSDRHQHHYVRL